MQLGANKGSISQKVFTVELQASTLAQVKNHVPVDRTGVRSAIFGIGLTYGQMHRPPYLLVKQDIHAGLLNPRIRPDAQLAQKPRTVVRLKRCLENVLTLVSGRLHHGTILERERDAAHHPSAVQGRQVEQDGAIRAGLHWRSKYLP